MLAEVDVINKSLRTRIRTLSQCTDQVDLVLESIASDQNNSRDNLHQSKLMPNHIRNYNSFESGVIKLQRDHHDQLTREESGRYVI